MVLFKKTSDLLVFFKHLCYYIFGDYMKILFGTRNKNKAIEAKAIFATIAPFVQLVSLDEIDPKRTIEEPIEDGDSFYANSLIKAKYYFDKTNIPTLCDDSGIVVDALNGAPGIYSARFSIGSNYKAETVDKANNLKLLDLMKNEINKNAHYACEMVFYDGERIISGYGELQGEILDREVGSGGFGYDPLFFIPEYQKTLGEIDAMTKNKISHRYKAILNVATKINNEICHKTK